MKRVLFLLLPLALPALAFGDGTPASLAFVRDAVKRGEVISFLEVQNIVEKAYPGTLIEVELEYEDDRLSYEVEVITTDGRLLEIRLNAADGRILGVEDED